MAENLNCLGSSAVHEHSGFAFTHRAHTQHRLSTLMRRRPGRICVHTPVGKREAKEKYLLLQRLTLSSASFNRASRRFAMSHCLVSAVRPCETPSWLWPLFDPCHNHVFGPHPLRRPGVSGTTRILSTIGGIRTETPSTDQSTHQSRKTLLIA